LSKSQAPSTPEEEAKVSREKHKYASLIGSALYAALSSRFDISFAVNNAARHAAWPGPAHFRAIKRTFRYLRGSHTYCVQYGKSATEGLLSTRRLYAYTDSDWAGNPDDRSSTSCHIIYFCGGPVQATTRRLKCIALSSTDAEYYSLSDTARELTHIRRLAADIMGKEIKGPTQIMVDNSASMKIAESEVCSRRSKHIELRHHHIRQLITNKTVTLVKIDTLYNLADIGTKSLPTPRFMFLRDRIMAKKAAGVKWHRPMDSEERQFYDRLFGLRM